MRRNGRLPDSESPNNRKAPVVRNSVFPFLGWRVGELAVTKFVIAHPTPQLSPNNPPRPSCSPRHREGRSCRGTLIAVLGMVVPAVINDAGEVLRKPVLRIR